jgi:carbon-monoxide dehydrogenase catalytic subunit
MTCLPLAQVIFQSLPTNGAKEFDKYLQEGLMDVYGAHWNVAEEPLEIAKLIIEKIEAKRDALGINKKTERVLFDMEMRRDLSSGIGDAGCTGPVKDS